MLGSIFAILSAASFALNNATVRRGVVSGTPIQAMAVSVPLGVVCFLPLAFLTGELFRLSLFPKAAVAFAGTYVVGLSLERYHRVGYGLTREERRVEYENALSHGRSVAEFLLAGLKKVDAA